MPHRFEKPSHTLDIATSTRVGFFLAFREVRRANPWTTLLISAVMMLTFLNLVVVSGILVGLIQGASDANRVRYSSDVIVSNLREKSFIQGSASIAAFARRLPAVEAVSERYIEGGRLEAGYKTRLRDTDLLDSVSGLVAGIDPTDEDRVSGLGNLLIEGEYLRPGDFDKILVGAGLLYEYTPVDSPSEQSLRQAGLGSKVRLTIGDVTREVTIKGVLKSKVNEVDRRIFMLDTQLQKLIGRTDYNVDEIAIKVRSGYDPVDVKGLLIANGASKVAKVQTWEEAQPKFLNDVKVTFALLGNLIGSVGLAVASITIFIVIFVNAITRRKYIGILKGIGVSALAIEISYILQSIFYSFVGTGVGLIILYGFLQPYIIANPIDFPFSDGVLVATATGTGIRIGVLFIATLIAGYIPARIVVKQNTLDSILGR